MPHQEKIEVKMEDRKKRAKNKVPFTDTIHRSNTRQEQSNKADLSVRFKKYSRN